MAIELPSVEQSWQADTAPYVSAMDAAIAVTEGIVSEAHNATAAILELQAALDSLHGRNVNVGVDTSAASAAAAAAAMADLTRAEEGAGAGAAAAAAAAEELARATEGLTQTETGNAAAAAAAAAAMEDLTRAETGSGAGAAAAAAAAADLAASQDHAGAATVATAVATDQAANASRRAMNGFTAWLGGLNQVHVALFSGVLPGILGSVSGLHLLADAAIETAAVIIPASIALASFGVAAGPAIQDITHHLQALYTVSQATSQAVYPMTGAFTRVADAVRPQVFQLFGEALGVINHNTGTFMNLATSTGTVLDQLGARLEMALTSGNGFHIFLANATQDLAKLGDMVGNVGGVLGNVLKTVPGYAQYLLTFADGITKVAEAVTGSGLVQGVMKFGLSAHGALLYTGLLATGAEKLLTGFGRFPGILSLASDGLGAMAVAAGKLGGEGNVAEHALGGLSSKLSMAQGISWGWITLGAAALGGFIYYLVTAKDAADNFISAFDTKLGATPLSQVSSTISTGLLQMDAGLSAAKTRMDQFKGSSLAMGHALAPIAPGLQNIRNAAGGLGNWFVHLSDSIDKAVNSSVGLHLFSSHGAQNLQAGVAVHDYQAYANEIQKLTQESVAFQAHLGLMSHALGGTAQAMGILTAAGITADQMMSTSASTWAQVIVQVNATVAAYRAMGQIGGVLGADMNAMTIAGSDQVTQMAKLNQAWDSTISIVSGGQSAFVSFEQALGQGYKSISGVSAAAAVAGASMAGMNTQSLALRAAWQNAYTSGAQVVDALRMMISASPQAASMNKNLTQSVKDVVAQLAVEGSKSAATRAELVSLAQEVNPSIHNFQQLRQWLGNTGNAGADLNRRLAAMGVNIQNLASDASQLSGAMQQHVVQAFSLAKLAANGTNTDINNLANSIAKSASQATIHAGAMQLYADLVQKDGMQSQTAAALVDSLTRQVWNFTGALHKVPPTVTTHINVPNLSATQAQVNQFLQTLYHLNGMSVSTYVNTYYSQVNRGGTGGYIRPSAHAAGTPSAAAGVALVGERGPELMLMHGGEQVFTAAQTASILAMSRSPAVNPAMLATGGGYGGGGEPGGHGGDIVVNVDGESLFRIMQTRGYRWQTRNAGVRTGLSVPGNQVGRA